METGTVVADVPAAYLPSGTVDADVRGVWFEDGNVSTILASRQPALLYAQQRRARYKFGGISLVFQNAEGRRHGFHWHFRGDAIRLSSGVFVVQPDGELVHRIVTHPYYAWGARERARVQGPFTVGPDGVPHRFRTRLVKMSGWGDNRVWGLSQNEGTLIGTDRDGRVFFRRQLQRRGRGVMPFRTGACVATEGSGVECFTVDGQKTVDLEVADATTVGVDAHGRIYAGTASKVYAFAPDGSARWADAVPGRSGDLALLPGPGLCTARGGESLSVVCYGVGPGSGAESSADPSL